MTYRSVTIEGKSKAIAIATKLIYELLEERSTGQDNLEHAPKLVTPKDTNITVIKFILLSSN